jgi:hypothetical protein
MSDFSDWLQNNWIDLARLAVQGAILAVVVSYGRKLLTTLRASQEQVGALLKLSLSDTSAQQQAPAAAITESESSLEAKSFSSLVPEPLHAPSMASSRISYDTEREHNLGGRVLRESGSVAVAEEEPPAFTPWVAAPSMESQHVEVPSYAEVPPRVDMHPAQVVRSGNPISRWLQAPIRRPGVRRANPLRRMVRWLQAPAGN